MKINNILKEYKIELFTFPETMWERSGFYFPDIRTIYVNQNLSDLEKEKVILHELGHINHDPKLYARLLIKYENEADRYMVRELIKKYLTTHDVIDFNWLQFAETYKISTTWGQQMILEEFKNLI